MLRQAHASASSGLCRCSSYSGQARPGSLGKSSALFANDRVSGFQESLFAAHDFAGGARPLLKDRQVPPLMFLLVLPCQKQRAGPFFRVAHSRSDILCDACCGRVPGQSSWKGLGRGRFSVRLGSETCGCLNSPAARKCFQCGCPDHIRTRKFEDCICAKHTAFCFWDFSWLHFWQTAFVPIWEVVRRSTLF